VKQEEVRYNVPVEFGSTCVAWFKLSELITRKEKEKALSLYRLLSHSFDDKAYALQLEGDILWSLEDKQALEKYDQAAFLYKKEQRLTNSVAVYQHLLTLEPKNFDFFAKIITLYFLLCWKSKFEENYNVLLDYLEQGVVSQDKVFDLSSKIIDLVFGSNVKDAQNQTFMKDSHKKANKKFAWALKSLFVILKHKNKTLYKLVKEYRLENKLNFDS
jgi:hypothetical protein